MPKPKLTLLEGSPIETRTVWRIDGTSLTITRIRKGGGHKSWHEPVTSTWSVTDTADAWVVLGNDGIRARHIRKHEVSVAKYVLEHKDELLAAKEQRKKS